jgi:hypothetical protein
MQTTPTTRTDGQQATQQYERLRALALGQPGAAHLRRELTLVLQRGLPAWLQAWRQCSVAIPVVARERAADVPVPSASQASAELASLLAAMALAHLPGRSAQA